MDIASLNQWITLQEPTGLNAEGYNDKGRVPANITMVDSGGSEVLRFGIGAATGYFKVTMRYRSDLKANWRIVHTDGRVFQISSYGDPDGKRQATQVYVTELQ
jgi:head-tail adaptor